MPKLEYVQFATNETPHCLWDIDNVERNLDFLDRIDPGYFQHVADVNSKLLDGEEKQYAATALRIAYSHGLETMFALLCATAQAHDCIVGWMLRYQNRDLYEVIRKIDKAEPIYTKLNVERVTWEVLVGCIFRRFHTGNSEEDSQIKESFGDLWRRFASDYLSDNHGFEYNSIKHGLRAGMSGTLLAMSEPYFQGEQMPTENMQVVANSPFGSCFLVPEKLGDSRNFFVRQQDVNWNPQKFIDALKLISMSITNIIGALKAFYGEDQTKIQFLYFENKEAYKELWDYGNNLQLGITPRINETHIKSFTREEILSVYNKSDDNNSKSS